MAERARTTAHQYLAAVGPANPGEAIEKLLLPLAFQRRDAEHLAEVKREADAVQDACLQVAHLDRDVSARRRARRGGFGRRHLLGDGAEHQLHDALLPTLRRLDYTDRAAVSQHRRPVA